MSLVAVVESELSRAERISRRLLEPLGSRWRHTIGVAERAQEICGVLERPDADVLVATAYLHDVGYAPELSRTGFHPLDGARFVQACGEARVAGLVAYHCSANAEAAERGLLDKLLEFEDERSLLSRALTYCDLRTDRDGRPVGAEGRLAEIRERYAPATPQARALERSRTRLLADVHSVETMLDEHECGGSERQTGVRVAQ